MKLIEHYNSLWDRSLENFQAGNFQLDDLIDDPSDLRRGVTLLTRPGEDVLARVNKLFEDLNGVEPEQYYYPLEDIHLTILSLISCYSGFDLNKIKPQDYVELTLSCLEDINTFDIRFSGITASSSSIMIQGFPEEDTLDKLRNRLRSAFKRSALEQSIDKRYAISTAHLTVVRFKKPVNDFERLITILEKYREADFGVSSVSRIHLVFNDWYQRMSNTKELKQFDLNKV